ncbi:hypothetical protein Tco_1321107 [Tanacetum coccineum]
MEQYLALLRENQAPGVVKPEIGGNVNFEIKSQFMLELREDTFSGNKNEDAHDHVDRVLNIGPIPGMTPTQALTAIQTMDATLKSGTRGHQAGTLVAVVILIDLLQS